MSINGKHRFKVRNLARRSDRSSKSFGSPDFIWSSSLVRVYWAYIQRILWNFLGVTGIWVMLSGLLGLVTAGRPICRSFTSRVFSLFGPFLDVVLWLLEMLLKVRDWRVWRPIKNLSGYLDKHIIIVALLALDCGWKGRDPFEFKDWCLRRFIGQRGCWQSWRIPVRRKEWDSR